MDRDEYEMQVIQGNRALKCLISLENNPLDCLDQSYIEELIYSVKQHLQGLSFEEE